MRRREFLESVGVMAAALGLGGAAKAREPIEPPVPRLPMPKVIGSLRVGDGTRWVFMDVVSLSQYRGWGDYSVPRHVPVELSVLIAEPIWEARLSGIPSLDQWVLSGKWLSWEVTMDGRKMSWEGRVLDSSLQVPVDGFSQLDMTCEIGNPLVLSG